MTKRKKKKDIFCISAVPSDSYIFQNLPLKGIPKGLQAFIQMQIVNETGVTKLVQVFFDKQGCYIEDYKPKKS